MATPDLCRVERCRPSNATSNTRPLIGLMHDLAHRPRTASVVLRRTKRSICNKSSSVKPK